MEERGGPARSDHRAHHKNADDRPRWLVVLLLVAMFLPVATFGVSRPQAADAGLRPLVARGVSEGSDLPQVDFSPSTLQLPLGQEALVDLMVRDVEDLYGYQLIARFDPDVVMALDADPIQPGVNVALGDFISPDSVQLNSCDNVSGTIRVTLVQLARDPVSGSGRLFSILLKAKALGDMDVRFDEVSLVDSHGKPMTVTVVLPDYEVVPSDFVATSTPTPTSTRTPLPSPTPTTTLTPTVTATSGPSRTPTEPGPQATPYFYLEPQTSQVTIGHTQVVAVRTSHVQDLVGVQFGLRWDPTVLQVLDGYPTIAGVQIVPGDIFEGIGTIPGLNQVNNGRGELGYSLALVNASAGVTGTWTVAYVSFHPLGTGLSRLEFFNTAMQEYPYYVIPSGAVDGEMRVISLSPTPTATVSDTPTATATEIVPTETPTATVTGVEPTETPTATSSPTVTETWPPFTPEIWLHIPLILKNA